MKKVMLLLGMILWTSCKSPTIVPIQTCFVSFPFGKVRCQMRQFDITQKNVGERIGDSIDLPLETIDNYMCISPDDWAVNLKPYMKEWHRLYFDRKN